MVAAAEEEVAVVDMEEAVEAEEAVVVDLAAGLSSQSQRAPTLPTPAIDIYEKHESMQIGYTSWGKTKSSTAMTRQ